MVAIETPGKEEARNVDTNHYALTIHLPELTYARLCSLAASRAKDPSGFAAAIVIGAIAVGHVQADLPYTPTKKAKKAPKKPAKARRR